MPILTRSMALLIAIAMFGSGTDAIAGPKKTNKVQKLRANQSGQELRMIELQSRLSQRQTALAQTTAMLKKMNSGHPCPKCGR